MNQTAEPITPRLQQTGAGAETGGSFGVTDAVYLGGLGLAGAYLWWRGYGTWGPEAADVLPCLAGIPVYAYLNAPWRLRRDATLRPAPAVIVAAAVLFAGGLIAEISVLLAAAWTMLLWVWIGSRVEFSAVRRERAAALLPLILLSFPWLTLDGQPIAWGMRLSAAWACEHLFAVLGFDVSRQGVQLLVQHLPVSVDAPCAGMNALQAMLIAGLTLGAFQGRVARIRDLFWVMPALCAIAWTANVLRVAMLSAAALTFGVKFAQGAFHMTGGAVVLILMFLLTMVFLRPRRDGAGLDQNTPASPGVAAA